MNLGEFYNLSWHELTNLNIRAFQQRVKYYEHIKELEEFERAKLRR